MEEQYIYVIEKALGLSARQVRNTLKLLDEGATIPFISRYRKDLQQRKSALQQSTNVLF